MKRGGFGLTIARFSHLGYQDKEHEMSCECEYGIRDGYEGAVERLTWGRVCGDLAVRGGVEAGAYHADYARD